MDTYIGINTYFNKCHNPCLRVKNDQCYESALPVFATGRTVQHSPQGASRNPSLKNRVTRKLNKNLPNSW